MCNRMTKGNEREREREREREGERAQHGIAHNTTQHNTTYKPLNATPQTYLRSTWNSQKHATITIMITQYQQQKANKRRIKVEQTANRLQ
jgi:hypothetical protein